MVPWPLIMITGMRQLAGGAPLLEQRDAVDVGHPDVEQHQVGPQRSRTARACAAFSASSTVWPSSVRISDSRARMPSSSSTTRMVAMRSQCACVRRLAPAARSAPAPLRQRSCENDNETCAPRRRRRPLVAGCCRLAMRTRAPCSSAIFFTTARPRPVPLALGGDIGLEGALEHLVGEAGAVVDAPSAAPRARSPSLAARRLGDHAHAAVGRSATASSAFCTRLWITWRSCVASPRIARQRRGAAAADRRPVLLRLRRTAPAPRPPARSGRAAAARAAGSRA